VFGNFNNRLIDYNRTNGAALEAVSHSMVPGCLCLRFFTFAFQFAISHVTCNDSRRNYCRRIDILPARRIHRITGWQVYYLTAIFERRRWSLTLLRTDAGQLGIYRKSCAGLG